MDSRLRWRCRRGMRELDLVLLGYLERRRAGFDETERATFEALLDTPDPELYGWLTGRGQPADSALQALVAQLKALRLA